VREENKVQLVQLHKTNILVQCRDENLCSAAKLGLQLAPSW